MTSNINLIPQYEVAQQTRLKVVRVSTILSILILIIVTGVSGYYYYSIYKVKQQITLVQADIETLRTKIAAQSEIEINARILYAKSSTLENILATRFYYSKMLDEIEKSTPQNVTVMDFNMAPNDTINLTGNGNSYNAIQDFINNLLANELFTNVSLNSVGLANDSDKGVSYFVVVNYDKTKLND